MMSSAVAARPVWLGSDNRLPVINFGTARTVRFSSSVSEDQSFHCGLTPLALAGVVACSASLLRVCRKSLASRSGETAVGSRHAKLKGLRRSLRVCLLAARQSEDDIATSTSAGSSKKADAADEKLKASAPEGSPATSKAAPEGTATSTTDKWVYLFERLFKDLAVYSSTPRRDATYWAIQAGALALAIGSDFFGLARFLLDLNPEAARNAGFDQVYAVEGLKVYKESDKFTLRYPGTWLFDQSVAFSKQAEREGAVRVDSRRRVIPEAAFGPAGGGIAPLAQMENLSVVAQAVEGSGRLEDILGEPSAAFNKLVKDALAPEGSGRTVEPLYVGTRSAPTGTVYEFEYILTRTVKGADLKFHTWAAAALGAPTSSRATRLPLYTYTLVCPEAQLDVDRQKLFVKSWRSFEVQG